MGLKPLDGGRIGNTEGQILIVGEFKARKICLGDMCENNLIVLNKVPTPTFLRLDWEVNTLNVTSGITCIIGGGIANFERFLGKRQ